MKIQRSSFRRSFLRILAERPSYYTTILLVIMLALFPACAGKKMSVEEAKQVTVSMSEKAFVPPPRSIGDILAVIDEPGQIDSEITEKLIAKADLPPPDVNSREDLAFFYKDRSENAWKLGRYKQSLEDSRAALHSAERENGQRVAGISSQEFSQLLIWLGRSEIRCGNFRRGVDLQKRAVAVSANPGSYKSLASSYIKIGDIKAAEEATEAGIRLCSKYILQGANWGPVNNKHLMQAQLLEAKGQFADAEPHIRSMINLAYKANKLFGNKGPTGYQVHRFRRWRYRGSRTYLVDRAILARNLSNQGRLIEAELGARETLKEVIGYSGKGSGLTGDMLGILGAILFKQSRSEDAEKLARAQISIYEASGISAGSKKIAVASSFLGKISVFRGEFSEAMKQFDLVKQSLLDNQYFYEINLARNPYLMLSLLKTNRVEEAMSLISSAYDIEKKSFGERHFRTVFLLGLRGMANAMMKNDGQAIKDFSEAIPILTEKSSSGFGRRLELKIVIEAYIDFLDKIRGSQLESEFGINASAEAFRLADTVFGSYLQEAIGASGARAAAAIPDLADLVRREQDALKQINALQSTFSNALAVPSDQQDAKALTDLKVTIGALSNARIILLDEIKKRFPKYSNFTSPQPVTVAEVQNKLHPTEAMILIYTSENRTYVWAIPYKGEIQFSTVPLSQNDVVEIVAQLRKGLDPGPETLGDIPEFDLTLAYEIYSKVLEPVEDGWKGARSVIIIAPGSLGQLPFSVLPVAPFKLRQKKGELFSNYREVPWLIRKVSITRLPSVSSFTTLRALPAGNPDRKAFAGFGDPLFNQEQLAQAEKEQANHRAMLASRGGNLHVRGIRVTQTGDLDDEKITSSHLGLLNRLPETAEEIKSIAKALDADLTQDIFLGKNASEHQVKTMDLSDRRVIAFASHGLVPGDLDGLDQPAIALSAPSVTEGNEDGLLTMGEILKLRLNADWVVLSACNTGAADGAGAEAISGLGRAFFYAGTRAILVSMWPVETTSAKKLTTRLFQYQREDKILSRARALQKSILALIDDPGLKDEASGKIVASYAHPLFWAPFIIVGEGGGSQN